MLNYPIMNVSQLQLSVSALVKKLADASVAIPVTVLKKVIRFLIAAWSLPVVFVIGGVQHVWQTASTEPEPSMPSTDEIVSNIRKLQNSVLGISSRSRATADKCPFGPDCKECSRRKSTKTTLDKPLVKIDSRISEPHEGEFLGDKSSCPIRENPEYEGNGDKSEEFLGDGCSCPIRKNPECEGDKSGEFLREESFSQSQCENPEYESNDNPGELIGEECSSQSQCENPEYEVNCNKRKEFAVMTLTDFYGDDLMWDVPRLAKKAKYLVECLRETDSQKVAAARRALEEHHMTPYELVGESYNSQGSHEIRSRKIHGGPTNKLKSEKRVGFLEDDGPKPVHSKEIQRNILNTCVSLLTIVSGLSYKIDYFMSTVTKLKDEIDVGRTLLCDVEADRNEMKLKLIALEKLIKEEQDYLDEISEESGYEETEHSPVNV